MKQHLLNRRSSWMRPFPLTLLLGCAATTGWSQHYASARPLSHASGVDMNRQANTRALPTKPLTDVLAELERKHQVVFDFDSDVVRNKVVGIANRSSRTAKLENVLAELLTPLDLGFEKSDSRSYVIYSKIARLRTSTNPEPALPAADGKTSPAVERVSTNQASLDRTVTGIVTDASNSGLPGVNVVVKGTSTGTSTDNDGRFRLNVPEGPATLVLSYIGYVSQEVDVTNRTTISVSLATDDRSLTEVVVVGYGTQKRSDLTGAVSSVKGEVFRNLPVSDLGTALQGRVPGLLVTQDGGQPGSGSGIVLRGPVSINGGSPLFVVDGVPLDGLGYNFNNQDIESIEVLKDASAAAIYGAKAAGGVILVTTKKGKSGQLRVGLTTNYGVRNAINIPKTLRRDDYLRAKEAFGFDVVDLYGPKSGWGQLPDTDWFNAVLRQGQEQNYTASLSGGTEKSRYYLSGNYNRIDGIRIGNWLERYTLRLNSEHQISSRLKFTETFLAKAGREDPNSNTNQGALSFRNTPVMAVYDPTNPNGGWGKTPRGFQGGHDVYSAIGNDQKNRDSEFYASGSLEYQILDGLTAKLTGGTRFQTGDNYSYSFPADIGSLQTEYFSKGMYRNQNYVGTLTLNYAKSFGKHTVSALVGYEARRSDYANLSYFNLSPLVYSPQSSDLFKSTATASGGFSQGDIYDRILSQFGRVEYNYAGKYLLTVNVRRDGYASKFGPNNQFGTFPGVSVGWKLSDEAFMNDVTFLTSLKLRAGYGQLGNSTQGDFLFQGSYGTGYSYDFGAGRQSSISLSSKLPNPDIRWESVATTNVGVDGAILNNRLSFNFDYYSRQTRDMVYNVNISPSAGLGGGVARNIGQLSNVGFEYNLDWRDKIGDFTYGVGFNGAFNTNKLLTLNPDLGNQTLRNGNLTELHDNRVTSRSEPGLPLGQFYGYQVLGIYQTKIAGNETRPKVGDYVPQAGDLIYGDLNNDGQINDDDKTYIGNPWPKLVYGLNLTAGWKGIDVTMLFSGVSGNQIYNGLESYEHTFFSDYTTTSKIFETSNFAGNGVTGKPRVGTLSDLDKNGNWSAVSSYHVQNGSYLRLRNLQVGYTLPRSVLDRAKISSLRVFVMADNLFTITSYKGINPDLGGGFLNRGIDNGNFRYPVSRLVSLGINAEF
ncbi:SusC/RagA family TonB-linked outer membrane protein [Fibrella aquatilis]|uniref:TonB-dependent receptor n=1 Tax=Fibrella aquatilis TaxID=2817059 RepID=A0A939G8U1_9BACT|nr:TonB-dependent receptor [Fibrella aquatilis]MBO0931923.1 TonB-dependent receptor [Fibrella aquatilis]